MRLTACVDPFIGTDSPGNCLPGPYLPFSLVRLSPDSPRPHDTHGYAARRPIARFSHTHVAGTGGAGRYGNIGVIPVVNPAEPLDTAFGKVEEHAEPGYYRVRLMPAGIVAELTVTPHVGVHRYTFPAGCAPRLLVDASWVIQVGNRTPITQTGGCVGGNITRVSARAVAGHGVYQGGWGHKEPYTIHFHCECSQPFTQVQCGDAHSALLTFDDSTPLEVRVGISLMSAEKAAQNLQRETAGRAFGVIRAAARATWEQTLGRVQIQGGTAAQRTLFYTSLYHLCCLPTDLGVDDEHPVWRSGVRHFWDFYCLWDSVRNANSLLLLMMPELYRDMLNCLLDIAAHTGWLPDAWIAGHRAQMQGGSSADVLFCEAALKGLDGIDYAAALACMRKNAEEDSPDPRTCGRIPGYRERGCLTPDAPQCVSRSIEYAVQDHCIGTLAATLGQHEVAAVYQASAQRVWALWRDDLKCFAPRDAQGAWITPFDPWQATRPDFWHDPYFYEGTAHEWSLGLVHAVPALIQRHGGAAAFVAHLDHFFDRRPHWKEITLHTPFLYNHAGRPDKTAERVRTILADKYTPTRNGLPDNEDMGAQSAFYICAALGLYPQMGSDTYCLSSPLFAQSDLQLGARGRVLRIEAPAAGAAQQYITAAWLNDKPLDRAWLRHDEIARGGVVRMKLSAQPTGWGQQ